MVQRKPIFELTGTPPGRVHVACLQLVACVAAGRVLGCWEIRHVTQLNTSQLFPNNSCSNWGNF